MKNFFDMKKYCRPFLGECVELSLEKGILAGSVVDTTTVETAGQQNAGFYDASQSDTGFNHQWGD